jgi:hypothetical protein
MCSLATLILATSLAAGGSLSSGPQVGDKLGDFKVHAFSGPDAGMEVKFLDKSKGGPALVIFVQKLTRPGFRLLRAVDEFAAGEERLKTSIVWVDEKEKADEYLKRAKNSLNFQSPVLIGLDGTSGPPAYGLNDQAAVTILVARDNRVVANFALGDPNETDARKVIAAAKKALAK